MDCAESLTLLSDFHDRALDDERGAQVRSHLSTCPPCANVFDELGEIVNVAVALNTDPQIAFPDEEDFWRRMRLADPKIH